MYIPKINLPVESTEHARWLEKCAVEQKLFEDEVRKFMASFGKGASANATQVAVINSRETPNVAVVPQPALTGTVLRGLGSGRPIVWAPEWQGLMPEYNVSLAATGGTWAVINMNIGYDDSYESDVAKSALPPVEFADGGTTMLPIRATSYGDALRPGDSGGQTPMVLRVTVNPTAHNDPFAIHVPYLDHSTGTSAPFYKLLITNPTAFDASVELFSGAGSQIFYAGTAVPLMGALDVPFTVAAGVAVAWHVELFSGISAAATPVYGYIPSLSGYGWYDPYYAANLA